MWRFICTVAVLTLLGIALNSAFVIANTVLGATGSAPDHSITSWRWSYLDPTPRLDSSPDGARSPAYPFTIGVADKDKRDLAGERGVPAIRYAHAAVATHEEMIITHGYHYDMANGGGATWLSDTWSFSFRSHLWTRLHDHVRHPLEGPTGRYAFIAALVGGDLFLHGGDDGGYAENLQSYKHSVYGDLWRFVLVPSSSHNYPMLSWVRIKSFVARKTIGASNHVPLSISDRLARDDLYRCQHAAVVVPIAADHPLAVADSRQETARGLQPVSETTPYLLVTHGLYSAPKEGEGQQKKRTRDGGIEEAYDVIDGTDIWVFSFRSKIWRQLRVDTGPSPSPRFGHSLTYVPDFVDTLPKDGSAAGRDFVGEWVSAPKGKLFVYGGFSRAGENRGDLWAISLTGGNEVFPEMKWVQIHQTVSDGSTPGRRGYANMFYPGIRENRLHLFGGARCEPGCVCSAEYWLYELNGLTDRVASRALSGGGDSGSGAKIEGWKLLANSPHSPSSVAYPSREPSGASQGFKQYQTPIESVKKGWPVHRYKQSMVKPLRLTAADNSGEGFRSSAYLFGGESYNPSGYYLDVWRFTTHTSPARSALIRDAVSDFDSELDFLLHFTTHSSFDVPLPKNKELPQRAFDRHERPGGWGTQPRVQHTPMVLAWDEKKGQMANTPYVPRPRPERKRKTNRTSPAAGDAEQKATKETPAAPQPPEREQEVREDIHSDEHVQRRPGLEGTMGGVNPLLILGAAGILLIGVLLVISRRQAATRGKSHNV